jgi:hypothetical protein
LDVKIEKLNVSGYPNDAGCIPSSKMYWFEGDNPGIIKARIYNSI